MQLKPEYIIRIENKISQLIDRYVSLKKDHEALKKEAAGKDERIATLQSKVQALEMQVKQVKEKEPSTTGLNKPALEKKINDYIKEIDRCISQLGEQD